MLRDLLNLDNLLEPLGLCRLSYYDKLKEIYVEETTRASQYAALSRELKSRVEEFEHKIDEGDVESKARWTSPDGKRVLKDLQEALNYCRDYQRALWIVLAPDNNYYKVKALLESWGMQPHEQVNDFFARGNPGIRDRTGQEYDSYGIKFIQPGEDVIDGVLEPGPTHTFEDIDSDDPKFKTDMTIEINPKPNPAQRLLESPDDE